MTNPLTQNLYTYCGNNPLNLIDPSGNGFFKNLGKAVKKAVSSKIGQTVLNVVQVAAIVAVGVAAVGFTVATFGTGAAAIAMAVGASAVITAEGYRSAGNIQQTWTATKENPQGNNFFRDNYFKDEKSYNTFNNVLNTAEAYMSAYTIVAPVANCIANKISGITSKSLASYTEKQIALAEQAKRELCENTGKISIQSVDDVVKVPANKGGQNEKLLWGSWDDYPKTTINGRDYAKIGDNYYTQHAVDKCNQVE